MAKACPSRADAMMGGFGAPASTNSAADHRGLNAVMD